MDHNKSIKVIISSILGAFLLLFLFSVIFLNNNNGNKEGFGSIGLLAMNNSTINKISYSQYFDNVEFYSNKYKEFSNQNIELPNFYKSLEVGYRDILGNVDFIFNILRKLNSNLTDEQILKIIEIILQNKENSDIISIEYIVEKLNKEYNIYVKNIKEIQNKLAEIKKDKELMNSRLERHLNDAYKKLDKKNAELLNYLRRQIIRANPGISVEDLNNILDDLYLIFDNIRDSNTLNEDLIAFIKYADEKYGVNLDLKIISEHKRDILKIESNINLIELEILKGAGIVDNDEYQEAVNQINDYLEKIQEELTIIENMTPEQVYGLINGDIDYDDVRDEVEESMLNEEDDEIIDPNDLIDKEFEEDSNLVSNKKAVSYIKSIEGNLLYTNLAGSTAYASINQLLYEGYKLQTVNDSTASIVFEDDSVLRLGSNTTITIEDKRGSDIVIKNERGSVWTRVLKAFNSKDNIIIESNTVSAAIRGTALYFEVKNSGRSNLAVVDSGNQDYSVVLEFGGNTKKLSSRQKTSFYNGNLDNVENFIRNFHHKFIRENTKRDLLYISVLDDDRKRLFNNNPLTDGQFSNDFLKKLQKELEVSIPIEPEEIEMFFINDELKDFIVTLDDNITPENIYEFIIKDNIINNIKGESNLSQDVTNALIDGFKNLDMNSLKESLGNLREINTRNAIGLDREIINKAKEDNSFREQIISSDNVSQILFDIYNEPTDEIGIIRRILENMKSDIEILKTVEDDKYTFKNLIRGISFENDNIEEDSINIYWYYRENLNSEWIEIEDITFEYDRPDFGNGDRNIEFKAILKLRGQENISTEIYKIEEKEETEEKKLARYAETLKVYMAGLSYKFKDKIDLSNFTIPEGLETVKISWNGNYIIDESGNLKRPSFFDGDKNTIAKANISIGNHSKNESFNIIIKAKDVTKNEINSKLAEYLRGKELSSELKEITLPGYVNGKDIDWNLDSMPKSNNLLKIDNNKLILNVRGLAEDTTQKLYARHQLGIFETQISIKAFGNCEFNGININHGEYISVYNNNNERGIVSCIGGQISGNKDYNNLERFTVFNITLNTDGGVIDRYIDLNYISGFLLNIQDLPTPNRENYIFKGWLFDGNILGEENITVIQDMELLASWQEQSRYPGCDTPDIVLNNGQVWAACNVGSSKAGFEEESFGYAKTLDEARNLCEFGYRLPSKQDWEKALNNFGGNEYYLVRNLYLSINGYNTGMLDKRVWTTGGDIYGTYLSNTLNSNRTMRYRLMINSGSHGLLEARPLVDKGAIRCIKDANIDFNNNTSSIQQIQGSNYGSHQIQIQEQHN